MNEEIKRNGHLVEELEHYRQAYSNDISKYFNTLIQQAITALQQNEWISVEDRLPELEQIILVYDDYEAKSAKRLFDMCFEDLYSRDILSVTHWMPLPTPPNK